MFYGTRELVKNTITKLRDELCCYFGPTCDCKYGYEGGWGIPKEPTNKKKRGWVASEKTACPELRCVMALLENITDEEYAEILRRPHTAWLAEKCQGEGI